MSHVVHNMYNYADALFECSWYTICVVDLFYNMLGCLTYNYAVYLNVSTQYVVVHNMYS